VPPDREEVVIARGIGVTGAPAIAMVIVAVAVLPNFRLPTAGLESVTLTPKE
jgi:hypothetical protein